MMRTGRTRLGRRLVQALAASVVLLFCRSAAAYEGDVHFGLTRWLAIAAGFEPGQADAIASGNQRVDGGLMDTLAMSAEFGCVSPDRRVAIEQQRRHFPSATPVPAPASGREVVPGSPAARAALQSLGSVPQDKALLLLAKLGEALHPLQDSWAHRGPPSGAGVWARYVSCEDSLLSFHGSARGMPETHEADLSWRTPEDLVEAARATYDVLLGYPPLLGKARSPKPFDLLLPSIHAFASGTTKSAKRAWFIEQGESDTRFLAGISLPDGPQGPMSDAAQWRTTRLPALPSAGSRQHEIDASVRAFFDDALAEWLSGRDLDALAARLTGQRSAPRIAWRLKLWTVRDHGAAAPFLHGPWPLQGARLRGARALTARARERVRTPVNEAVVPLQALAPYATPLLPYVASLSRDQQSGTPRAIALFRFVHAPYDTVALVAERRADGWRLVDVLGTPDH